ncbi:cytochrome c oxidase accessory protein CcoG [Rhodopirellula sallentina]|uniref:Iron-sulfur cluster-binding protein n=1 Tax=Rhodopirellula sallentina SM41 TaxID=1263870 RepID=M5UAC3_9BACT|nr:cytochrome c oxidase accessory protein CcoG [Rhodopirellula sallentina]EMI58370.1 iron-sulfur cluster-binding protein [Rhodopirellula sallentina SM41]
MSDAFSLPIGPNGKSSSSHESGCGKCGDCSCSGDSKNHRDDASHHSHANQAAPSEKTAPSNDALLTPDEHVLSTLERDGSRRWLRPKLSMGDWWKKRRVVAYILMVVFVAIPHLRIGGKPVVLLDLVSRQLTVLGKTFYPTDTLILAFGMLSVFITIVLITAIAGRAWCGWACPQTVYMEFLFRPIDRFFEGTSGKGGKPKANMGGIRSVARIAVYVVLCMFLAHTFLAYFVGTDRLAEWVRMSPLEHPSAFLVMAAVTGLMLFDFLIFREQLCLIACPYGRFQSVMLDEQSKIVAYDPVRGEPRVKGKRPSSKPAGDCVDCNQCVVVCPTGIDIRDGLQMECINCTQCIDACNSVMEKVGLPTGLIRYSSQDEIARKPKKLLRARTIVYPIILLAVMSGFAYAVSSKVGFDARLLRGKGAPFSINNNGSVNNSFKLRLVNRTHDDQNYTITIDQPEGVTLEVIQQELLSLPPGGNVLVPLSVEFKPLLTRGKGNTQATMVVRDESDHSDEIDFKILGPR